MKKITEDRRVYTHFRQIEPITDGFQIKGSIKNGKKEDGFPVSHYSIDYVINLTLQPSKMMIGRVGDARIGYFYNNIKIETETHITGNPLIIINRKNLDTSSSSATSPSSSSSPSTSTSTTVSSSSPEWTYVIDATIPQKYHPLIASGILSWNQYFDSLGLGQPLKVLTPDQIKGQINVFDPQYCYVIGTEAEHFNGYL